MECGKERIIVYGNENRCIDQLGNLIYSSEWFLGLPTISEVIGPNDPLSTPGYNIPISGSREWKRLWWSVTDIECDANPVWAMVSLKEFLVWITKNGFTGKSDSDWNDDGTPKQKRKIILRKSLSVGPMKK